MVATPTSSLGFQNFYSSTLSADASATATDIFINVVPSVSEGFLVLDPDSTTGREIIYYSSKTATKVVCPSVADGRGQGDTSASLHLSGTTVIMAPIAEYFETLVSLFTTTPQGWTTGAGTITAVTYSGNRSYSLSTSSDLSAVVSPGMRLSTTRTVAAPTQCTSLNGTNQYYSKTSPNKMTFTDDFVVSAWVKLSSYAVSGIISRYNGTSGWILQTLADGRVQLNGFNAGAGNVSTITSYQSIPLNRWVHIAAQLDMSTFTATTTTSYIMFDGVDVPGAVTRTGTNPTALIQAGNLEIGSFNGGTSPFPGKIAQAAIFNAKVTQATMRGYISQGLSGSETSLASAYSFNNAITDLNTTTPNDLTAQGSAVATNADSPFGYQAGGTISSTLDYGIIQTVSASTLVVQVPEGCTIPTTGGVTSFRYSTYKSPFGFPGQRDKWFVESHYKTDITTSSTGTAQATGHKLNVPIGAWKLCALNPMQTPNSASFGQDYRQTISASTTAEDDTSMTTGITNSVATGAAGSTRAVMYVEKYITLPAETPYYRLETATTASLSHSLVGTVADAYIKAENAYL